MARDAQSSGDSVMAENYLQHAEHYFRIVSSAQQALNGPRDGQSQDETDFDDDANDVNSRFSSPQPHREQPVAEAEEEAPQGAEPSSQGGGEEPAPAVAADGEQQGRKPRERRPRRRRARVARAVAILPIPRSRTWANCPPS